MSALRTLQLGPGHEPRAGAVTVDLRRAPGVSVVADPRRLPFPDGVFLEIHVASVLERTADPHVVLDEIHRVLRGTGRAEIRVRSPWAFAEPLDRADAFAADLRLWRQILGGYFDRVRVRGEGTRYRDNALLRAIVGLAIGVLGWRELAEVWRFECGEKQTLPQRRSVPAFDDRS
jgi:SAM-dependent methyltransferase